MNVTVYENKHSKMRLIVRPDFNEQQIPDSVIKEFGTLNDPKEMDLNSGDESLRSASEHLKTAGFFLDRNFQG